MRLERICTLFVLVPALATGLAVAPIWCSGQPDEVPATERSARADLPTEWISAFVDQLQLPERQVATVLDEVIGVINIVLLKELSALQIPHAPLEYFSDVWISFVSILDLSKSSF